ncbi:MAG: 4Fe-4S ferredoxin [Deltaproteobacteria bacterium]|jgi:Pyruvate/2-oxoacid:ferredoxin oxidoreductase delta subunit|nr:4Fe-4S ferredoxin [Deltaproteobacteria bacterium]
MTETAKNLKPFAARDIIEIDEELCDGCGLCVPGCAEGALAIVDGKARLVSDVFCDGLGACLGECPRGALRIVRRPAEGFDAEAALAATDGGRPSFPGGLGLSPRSGGERVPQAAASGGGGCPGAAPRALGRPAGGSRGGAGESTQGEGPALVNWPIQMMLVPPQAPFLESPALTVAADCTAFACPGFRREFLEDGAPLVIGCPKLDDVDAYIIKIGEILKAHPAVKEIRVPIMEVPCCRGLAYAAARGAERSGRGDVTMRLFVVGLDGTVSEEFPETEGEKEEERTCR